MAKDSFIKHNIEQFRTEIKQARDDNELDRTLMLFAKEVERETRHSAADLAQKLASEITNL